MPTSLRRQILSFHTNRIFGLDLLRAIAILTVVYGHAVQLVPHPYQSYHNVLVSTIDGVSIFFVLSGYLIGTILIKSYTLGFTGGDLLHFWLRRWLRTLPAYFFVLTAIGVIAQRQGQLEPAFYQYYGFSQNLLVVHPRFFTEAWSLAVEEWFYLLFPLSLLVVGRGTTSPQHTLRICIALFLAFPQLIKLVKYQAGMGFADWDGEYRRIVLLRLDSIAIGILAAYTQRYAQATWQWLAQRGLWLAAPLLAFLFLYPKLVHHPLWYNIWVRAVLESGATFLVLPYLSQWRAIQSRRLQAGITFISVVSYSMYLLNQTPLIRLTLLPLQESGWFAWLGQPGWLVLYVAYWVLLLTGSALMYRYIEYPFLRYRDWLESKLHFLVKANPHQ